MARHIAIVEDEPAIRANYVEALTRIGYHVQGYASRPDASRAVDAPHLARDLTGTCGLFNGDFDGYGLGRRRSQVRPRGR